MASGLPTCKKHGLAYDPAVSAGCVVCRRSESGVGQRRADGLIRWWPALALSMIAVISTAAIVMSAPAAMSASVRADSGEPEPVVADVRPSPRSLAPASPQDQAEAERARLVVEVERLLDQLRPQTVACFEGGTSACLNAGSRCVDLMKHLDLPAQKATALAAPRRKLYNPDIDSAWARLCGAKGTAPFDKSCELGNQESCKQACSLGSHQSCLSFAEWQSDPKLAERFRNQASILSECEQRGDTPCVLPIAPSAEVSSTNAERATISKAESECQQGAAPACLSLAQRYEAGQGVPRDLRRALELRQKACDVPPHACLDLAKMYTFGTGVAKDEQRALSIVARHFSDIDRAAKECGPEQTLECLFAHMGSTGAVRPEYLARFAPQTYERECRRGNLRACIGVEELYRNGVHGFEKDVVKADELAALAATARNRKPSSGP